MAGTGSMAYWRPIMVEFHSYSHSFHLGYIQWLFPLYEYGMQPAIQSLTHTGVNQACPPLVAKEAEVLRKDPECQQRLFRAYQMMLDFYGMEMANSETGEIRRSTIWQGKETRKTTLSMRLSNEPSDRYRNLNSAPHNFLRITRILKALGDLGFQRYQKPWLDFLITEIYEHGMQLFISTLIM
jgi:hypothetical protein